MNDPHVDSLKFRVETGEGISYGNPAPVEGEAADFRFRLERDAGTDMLTVNMKTHYASEAEAVQAVQPFLSDWQAWTALNDGLDRLAFRFHGAHVVDRAPQAGVHHERVGQEMGLVITGSATNAIVLGSYAAPPERFRVTPDVAVMWNRYENFLRGREPLLSVAYFCFSFFILAGGGRRELAAAKYAVDEDVLKKLSTVAATRGDWSEARKAEGDSTATPLSSQETEWVNHVLKRLIERMAAHEADPSAALTQITLSDFPTI